MLNRVLGHFYMFVKFAAAYNPEEIDSMTLLPDGALLLEKGVDGYTDTYQEKILIDDMEEIDLFLNGDKLLEDNDPTW